MSLLKSAHFTHYQLFVAIKANPEFSCWKFGISFLDTLSRPKNLGT